MPSGAAKRAGQGRGLVARLGGGEDEAAIEARRRRRDRRRSASAAIGIVVAAEERGPAGVAAQGRRARPVAVAAEERRFVPVGRGDRLRGGEGAPVGEAACSSAPSAATARPTCGCRRGSRAGAAIASGSRGRASGTRAAAPATCRSSIRGKATTSEPARRGRRCLAGARRQSSTVASASTNSVQLARQPVVLGLEVGVAEAVAAGEAVVGRPAGRRRERPDVAGVAVAQIEEAAGAVLGEVLLPAHDHRELRVVDPGEAAAGLGDGEADARVGDDVDPGARRCADR